MPSNAPAMRMAGPITSAGWPRLQPGATRARIPGTAALAGSDCLPLSIIIVPLEPIALAMDLPAPFAWLVDEAGASLGPDQFLAELGGRLLADGLPLAGGALTLAVPHPIIARRTWLWRSESGAVIEALGFAAAGLPGAGPANPPGDAGRGWLAGLGGGPAHEDIVGPGLD